MGYLVSFVVLLSGFYLIVSEDATAPCASVDDVGTMSSCGGKSNTRKWRQNTSSWLTLFPSGGDETIKFEVHWFPRSISKYRSKSKEAVNYSICFKYFGEIDCCSQYHSLLYSWAIVDLFTFHFQITLRILSSTWRIFPTESTFRFPLGRKATTWRCTDARTKSSTARRLFRFSRTPSRFLAIQCPSRWAVMTVIKHI